jgi:hypothetical protein
MKRIVEMSEYQRYEFMTIDRPLTGQQLDAVNDLSSHIEASSTHALIEYNWGDFQHDPIKILHRFFDGFFYWASWGTTQMAFRFPHGILPTEIAAEYSIDEFVTLTQHADYDILSIDFDELESVMSWTDYDLESFISIRNELMEGDLRALYIVWLAGPYLYKQDEEEDEEDDIVPPVPPAFGTLTEAQRALANLSYRREKTRLHSWDGMRAPFLPLNC